MTDGGFGQLSQLYSLSRDIYRNVLSGEPEEAFVTEAENSIEFRYRETRYSPMMYRSVDKEELSDKIQDMMVVGNDLTYSEFHRALENSFSSDKGLKASARDLKLVISDKGAEDPEEAWIESDTYRNLETER